MISGKAEEYDLMSQNHPTAPYNGSGRPGSKKVSNDARVSGGTVVQIVVSILIAVVVIVCIIGVLLRADAIDQNATIFTADTGSPGLDATESEPEEEPEPETIYENIAVDDDDIYAGDLILVNADYAYVEKNAEEITSIYSYKTDNNISTFSVSGADTALRLPAIEAFSDMMSGFYIATGHDDIIVESGYRSTGQQQALYDADLELTGQDFSDLVALPGHSEHESGYSMDISIYNDDGTIGDYDGTGEYDWINQNCSHYGYILRYTAEKSDITGIQSEEWHYRYVGQPHATYMYENDLCLEEYIDLLRDYDIENHLAITNWDGEIYEVYYVPVDTSADITYVLVPAEHDYTISGNNVDGFIVTVDTGEIATFEETADETEPTTEPAE